MRAVIREALVGVPLGDPRTLRERLRDGARARTSGRPRGTLPAAAPEGALAFGRTPEDGAGPAAWRRASLPAAVAPALLRLARASGQPTAGSTSEASVQRVRYAPDLLPTPARGADEPGGTAALPILHYERVAPLTDGRTLDGRTVEPDAFAGQLRLLRERGYQGASLDEWVRAVARGAALEGRRVAITFALPYRSFADHAWPLLERSGFSATVFVPTDLVGGAAPRGSADPGAPLLGWDDIVTLRARGVRFGSASASYRALAGCPPEEVAREAVLSRLALEERLGAAVRAFAYPHAVEDEVVQHVIGACGYACALSGRPGRAALSAPLLSLPRVAVPAGLGATEFLARVGEAS
jgi:peptidoglycan/xylan/chitin deacetylase (PgdA/CDA1 family)